MSTNTYWRQVLLSLLIILILVFQPVLIDAQTGSDAYSQLSAHSQTVATAVNQMRIQAGLPPLAMNSQLNLAAQNHVNDMVANYIYSHTGSDGSSVQQRVQRTGYIATTWVSENWVSVSDPNLAIQWWMNSYAHRNNILNRNWQEFGLGAGYQASNSQYIFVAVFAAGESGEAVTVRPPDPKPLPIPAGGLQYQIQRGDTLLSIGLRYGVEWPMIAGANHLNGYSILQIGQVIRIPGVKNIGGFVDREIQAASTTATSNDTTVGASAQRNFAQEETFIRRYTVQRGNTLAGIATIYDLSWQELARENGLSEFSLLEVGQELRIPGAVKKKNIQSEPVGPKSLIHAANHTPSEHVIAVGDTIISIAVHYQIDWQDLLRLNSLRENSVLQLGQTIRLR